LQSHDRYFPTAPDKIFAFESGATCQYPNFSVYLDFKKAEEEASNQAANSKEKREVQPVVEKSQKQALDTNKPQTFIQRKREFEMIEGKIAQPAES